MRDIVKVKLRKGFATSYKGEGFSNGEVLEIPKAKYQNEDWKFELLEGGDKKQKGSARTKDKQLGGGSLTNKGA